MLQPADIPERHSNHGDDYARVVAEKPANGTPKSSNPATSPSNQPGLAQLVVCVLGIYISLYVLYLHVSNLY